ncbi:MAG: hypothetical protein J7M25_06785 [Deltaproteobacteria bacterium]|nr:hypothetical protein [Deltaproteobacteria bacterium]
MKKRTLVAALIIPSLLLWGCGKHSDGKAASSKNSKAQKKNKPNAGKALKGRPGQTPRIPGPKTSAEVRIIVDSIKPPRPSGTGKVLAIVFSGGIRGEIEPCG